MTYQQTVLNDKPAGFWMITAASGTSETDLSGNSKTATITEATDLIDRAYRPLVTGTSTDRAFRLYSGNHKLTYPALEIWEKGRNHIPFSVEFTVQPITSRRRVDLFAPQEASSASVPDNGIFLENGRLYFSVSNGSASSVPTVKSVASTWLSTGTTYHVVAVYSVTSVSLYVDGVLADSAPVDPAISWSHTVANFITTAYSLSSDTISSSFLFDAVSVYRAELSPTDINNHYVMSTPNLSETEIVNSLGGKIIQLNDGDRIKAFDYSAKEKGWSSNLNTITNLVQNDDGSIGLKKIKPLKMYSSSINYNNLLAPDEASFEGGIGGWTCSNATLASSGAQSISGSKSLIVTKTGAGDADVVLYPTVTPGKTYTLRGSFRSAAVTLNCAVLIIWRNAAGGTISQSTGNVQAASSSVWKDSSITAVAPDGAVTARIDLYMANPAVSDVFYWDNIAWWEGAATTYVAPLVGQTFTPGADISKQPRNVLVWGGATAEEAYSGMVTSNTNQSLARVSTDFYSGSNSWQVTSTGAGASVLSITHSSVPVEAGKTYTLTCKVKPVTTARNIQQYVNWYDSSNALISSSTPTGNTTTLNVWTTVRKTIIAPPKAVKGDLYTQTTTNMVTGEVFYFDEIGLIEGDVTQWVAPTFNNSPYEFSSKEFKYASMGSVGEILGADQGAIGTFAMFTAVSNDDVQEQVILSVSSSSQNHILEVVKKADKNLYIRYIYKNTSGVTTTTETSWGAISSLLGGLPYIYLEWGGGLASLYVNSTSSPAQIAFDAGIPSPRFDSNSYMNLGAGFDGTRPWNNYFRTTKIYDKVQPATEFNFNKTVIDGRIIKFEGNLNVSQVGSIAIGAQTGTDGTSANSLVTQTRATWWPLSSGISISSSPSNIGNMLTYNQATGGELGVTGWQGDNATIAAYSADKYSGQFSIEATSTSAVRVGIQTTTAAWAVAPGQVYTITCAVKSALTTLSGSAKFTVFDSVGGYLTDVGVTINTTGGGWNVFTGQVTIPANGYSVTFNPYLQTPIVGTKVYFDQMGFWLGTGTTWGEPYQTNIYGSEIVSGQFPSILPGAYYTRATLSTDDSYYAPIKLTDLKLEAFSTDTQFAENGWDQLVGAARDRIYEEGSAEIRQTLYTGAYVNSRFNNFYVYPVDDTTTFSIPDGGSTASTAGPAALARTVEFWVYPETQGYHFSHEGPIEYSMRYYDSGGFTTTGFTTLYVDGASVTNGTTSTTWYNRWHHIVLTNASAQIPLNTDLPAGVNLLTANQASVETDTTGLAAYTNCTVARSTAQSAHGAASLSLTATTATDMAAFTNVYPQAVVGKTYTASVSVKAGTVARSCYVMISWRNSGGTFISANSGTVSANSTTGWTKFTVTGVAPATATQCDIRAYVLAPGAGEVHYVDMLGFWEGASTKWALSGEIRMPNLLTYNESTQEVLTGISQSNATLSRDNTNALHGTYSIKAVPIAAAGFGFSPHFSYDPQRTLKPNTTYTASFWCRQTGAPAATNASVQIYYSDDFGANVSSPSGTTSVTNNSQWFFVKCTFTTPATTTRLAAYVIGAASTTNTESWWFDQIGLYEGTYGDYYDLPDNRTYLGRYIGNGTQSTARYQNVSYYPQTFDSTMVTTNYKAYLGDMTGGSVTDTAARTASDAINLASANQSSMETNVTTGFATPSNCSATQSATYSAYGTYSMRLSSTAAGDMSNYTSSGVNGIPVSGSKVYSAVCFTRATTNTRTVRMVITWYDSGGSFISQSAPAGETNSTTAWTKHTTTGTSPSNAVYAQIGPVVYATGAGGEVHHVDAMGLWEGAGTEWAPVGAITANPRVFNDIWTTETIKIR
jgi:hypothetical protein